MNLFKDVDKLIPLGKNKRTAKSLEEERLPEESTRATSSKKSPGAKSDDEKKGEQKSEKKTSKEEEDTDDNKKMSADDAAREKEAEEAVMERIKNIHCQDDALKFFQGAFDGKYSISHLSEKDLKCIKNKSSAAHLYAKGRLEAAQAKAKSNKAAREKAALEALAAAATEEDDNRKMAAGAPEGEEDRKMSSSGGGAGGPGPEWRLMCTPLPAGTTKVPNSSTTQKSGERQGRKLILYACDIQATKECVSRRRENPLFFRMKSKAKSHCPACRNFILDAREHVKEGVRICRSGPGSTVYIPESDEVKWTTVQKIKTPPQRLLADETKLRYDKSMREYSANRSVGSLVASGDLDKAARQRKLITTSKNRRRNMNKVMSAVTGGIKSGVAIANDIIPEHLNRTVNIPAIRGNVQELFRRYHGVLALLYIGKLTPLVGLDGKLEIPLSLPELYACMCDSGRKTALLNKDQKALSKSNLHRFTLATAPESIQPGKLGSVPLRMATGTQEESFALELELIKSVPQLKMELGSAGKRLLCINERFEQVGSTAEDQEGKPDPLKYGGVFANIFLLDPRYLDNGTFSFNADRTAKHQSNVAAQLPSNVSYRECVRPMSKKAKKSSRASTEGQKKRKAVKKDTKNKRAKSLVDQVNQK